MIRIVTGGCVIAAPFLRRRFLMRRVMKRAVCGVAALSFAAAASASRAALLPIVSRAAGDAVEAPIVPAQHYRKRPYGGPPYPGHGYGYEYGYGNVTPEQRYNIWVYRENQRWQEQQFRQQNPGGIYVPGQPPRGFDPR
jgi:hypothetical protein